MTIIKLIAAFGLICSLTNPALAQSTLCQVNEAIIFSCMTDKNNILSVCAGRHTRFDQGYLQYRSGTPQAVNLQYPSVKLLPSQAFKGRQQQYNGGQGVYLRFENNDDEYIIYSGRGKRWQLNGLIRLKNTAFKHYTACKSPVISNLDATLLQNLHIASDNDNLQFSPASLSTTW